MAECINLGCLILQHIGLCLQHWKAIVQLGDGVVRRLP
jgi:hypothetical protein